MGVETDVIEMENHRTEFEQMLFDDEHFKEMWGTPTENNEYDYKEVDFQEWFDEHFCNEKEEKLKKIIGLKDNDLAKAKKM